VNARRVRPHYQAAIYVQLILRKARYFVLSGIVVLVILSQGCASSARHNTLPASLEDEAHIPGLPYVRGWGGVPSKALTKSARESVEQEKAINHGKVEPVVSVLALSGGGGDGAFGAGLLCGWSAAGTRPTFKLVTGISTGALIAPFAFLGPAYDQRLKEAYTTVSDKDIYTEHNALAILLSEIGVRPLMSLASTKPLAKLLEKLIDAKMLENIAAEHLKGRRLMVGTTQLDAQRLVIWDMGVIAVSNYPQKLALFRKILLASASIPFEFPPQFFSVAAGGKEFQEMHVDGGVTVELMLYENTFKPFTLGGPRQRKLYIIRNQRIYAEWKNVQANFKSIASRAIHSLIKNQGADDLFRLYVYAIRDKLDYHLAYIPPDFKVKSTSDFDKAYMNRLFDYAYNRAKGGYPWSKYPPFFSPSR
jgi:predicted acylesterase/phospholipase RssA